MNKMKSMVAKVAKNTAEKALKRDANRTTCILSSPQLNKRVEFMILIFSF